MTEADSHDITWDNLKLLDDAREPYVGDKWNATEVELTVIELVTECPKTIAAST